MAQGSRRTAWVAALVVLAATAGFGGGWLVRAAAPASASARPVDLGLPWPLFGKPRAASAPRAAPHRPAIFTVWTTRLDASHGDPQACVRMSRPLDPARSYGDFVNVDPDLGHPPAVTVNGDELCVAGVGYAGHKITLLHGLPSATPGETLADDTPVDFSGEVKPAFVGFAGDGVILPREDSDGVGLETVNVSRLQIEVWRVVDRNLVRKSIETSDPQPEGGYDDDPVGRDGRKVWSGTVDVRAPVDQRATTVFPLGAVLKTLQPGAYVIHAKDGSAGKPPKGDNADEREPAQARRWILFTDMALQAYDGSDALDVTVRSLKTAKAQAGVRVALVGKDGQDLSAASTDAAGHVRFARALLAGEAGATPARVMAYGPQGDFTLLDLTRAPVDLSKQDVGGRAAPGSGPKTGKEAQDAASTLDGFLYADRGVYRPGETVHLVALLRDHLARAVADRAGALVIRRPSGLEFRRARFDRAPGGAASLDLALPRTAPRGRWTATLEMDGSDASSGEVGFQVEDFAPQRLAVTIAADAARPIVGGEPRDVRIDARFLYGAVAAGLPVQAETRLAEDADPFPALPGYSWGDAQHPFDEKLTQSPDTVTDGAGHAMAKLDVSAAADAIGPLAATVTASVFEPGGRPVSETAKLKVRPRPLYLGVKTSASGSGDTPLQTFEVVAVDPFGRRVAAPLVDYLLVAETWSYDWFEENGRWSWRRSSRDKPIAKGVLAVGAGAAGRISRRLPWGDYRLVLEDPATGARTVVRQSSGWGDSTSGEEAPDAARVSAERTDYRAGDTVVMHIQAPFAGEAQVAVATDRLVTLKSVTLPAGGAATVRLHADASWGGGAYVLVSVVQPRDPVASPKPRRALGVAYVPLKTPDRTLSVAFATPPKVDSRQPLSVPLTVKGLGLGGRAHVTVAAVDEGILRLTHQKNPDPVDWYFGKRELGLAYRDDYGRLLDPNLGAAAAVRSGGDEMGGAGLSATPIKTVALWSGVVESDALGHATVHLPAQPDFDGQLRLVAVAWTDKAVGSGVSDEIVRAPVVVELSPPRFLAPGDRASLALEIHDVEGRAGRFLAELFGRGGILAPFRQLLDLVVGQRVVAHPDITAPDRPGVGAVGVHVAGPGFDTVKTYPLETRFGWGPVTRATDELQRPGESWTPAPALLAGLSPGGVTMTVSYSPFRGFDPAPIAESLARYPYGCSEQLSSGMAVWLYGLAPDPRRGAAKAADAIGQLLDRESLDGSFGLWRVADGEADAWLGAYVVDALLTARAQGASVPDDALKRAVDAMRLLSRPEGFGSLGYITSISAAPSISADEAKAQTARLQSRATAYALYDLVKAGRGDLPRLRWFHDVGFASEPTALARAQVGAALAAMGDRGRAHDSFIQAVRALGYKAPDDAYQSPLRDLAGVVALAYEAGETGIARSLQGRLENTVRDPDALNTQEQAWLLRAAHAMLAASGPVRITAAGVRPLGPSRWAVGRLADARFRDDGGPIWRTVTVHGLPLAAPGAGGAGLSVEKRLFAVDGGAVDAATLAQGKRIVVRLTGRAADQRSRMTVIDDALPAGWEIESVLSPDDARQAAAAKPGQTATPAGAFAFLGALTDTSTQEKRDDRYMAALKLSGGAPFAVAYVARATTPGDFFLPGAEARDMYRPQVQAHSAAGRTRVAAAGP